MLLRRRSAPEPEKTAAHKATKEIGGDREADETKQNGGRMVPLIVIDRRKQGPPFRQREGGEAERKLSEPKEPTLPESGIASGRNIDDCVRHPNGDENETHAEENIHSDVILPKGLLVICPSRPTFRGKQNCRQVQPRSHHGRGQP